MRSLPSLPAGPAAGEEEEDEEEEEEQRKSRRCSFFLRFRSSLRLYTSHAGGRCRRRIQIPFLIRYSFTGVNHVVFCSDFHCQFSSKEVLFFRTRPSGQRCVLKNFWAYLLIEMQGYNLYRLFLHFKFSKLVIFHKSMTKSIMD